MEADLLGTSRSRGGGSLLPRWKWGEINEDPFKAAARVVAWAFASRGLLVDGPMSRETGERFVTPPYPERGRQEPTLGRIGGRRSLGGCTFAATDSAGGSAGPESGGYHTSVLRRRDLRIGSKEFGRAVQRMCAKKVAPRPHCLPGRAKEWRVARMTVVAKSGRPAGMPSAYRPICLLGGLGKQL